MLEGPEGLSEGSEGLPEGLEGLPEGSWGKPEGFRGLSEGSEGLPEVTKGLPDGPEGLPEGSQGQFESVAGGMDEWTKRIFPLSTGLCHQLRLLPKKEGELLGKKMKPSFSLCQQSSSLQNATFGLF